VGGGEYVFRVGRKLHVLAVDDVMGSIYYFIIVIVRAFFSYQMALCPSARVLRHCPDGKLHIRLRGEYVWTMRMKCDMYVVRAHEAIKRARHDKRAVSVEVHCGDVVDMGVQCFGASTCAYRVTDPGAQVPGQQVTHTFCCVPYPNIAFTTSRHKLRALSVVVDAKYIACMSFEDFSCQALPHVQNTPRLST
jgi:hypothetical protein